MRLSARKAVPADSDLLLSWRNDPLTRQHSRDSEPVTSQEHSDWLRSVIGNDDRHLYIVEESDQACVGTVRFDLDNATIYEVSLTVNPVFRGQGHGSPMLLCAEQLFVKSTPKATLKAFIKSGNKASIKLFESAGYIHEQGSWWSKRLDDDA